MRFPRILCLMIAGACVTLVPPAVAQHEHPAGEPEKLGKVNFPVSCDRAVQPHFNSAVAMLHSFWYEKASEASAAVAEKDRTIFDWPAAGDRPFLRVSRQAHSVGTAQVL